MDSVTKSQLNSDARKRELFIAAEKEHSRLIVLMLSAIFTHLDAHPEIKLRVVAPLVGTTTPKLNGMLYGDERVSFHMLVRVATAIGLRLDVCEWKASNATG